VARRLQRERENFSFYFPLATSIVVSIVITCLIWLFRKCPVVRRSARSQRARAPCDNSRASRRPPRLPIHAALASTILLSAFLLFWSSRSRQQILPWFGGTSAVWTCAGLLPVVLLLGYTYSH